MTREQVDREDQQVPCVTLSRGRNGPDLWYPTSERELPAVVGTACAGCWRRVPCLVEALTRPEEHGIWAGLPPARRQGLRRRMLLGGEDPDHVVRDGLALADELRSTHPRSSRSAKLAMTGASCDG